MICLMDRQHLCAFWAKTAGEKTERGVKDSGSEVNGGELCYIQSDGFISQLVFFSFLLTLCVVFPLSPYISVSSVQYLPSQGQNLLQ